MVTISHMLYLIAANGYVVMTLTNSSGYPMTGDVLVDAYFSSGGTSSWVRAEQFFVNTLLAFEWGPKSHSLLRIMIILFVRCFIKLYGVY